MGWGKNLDYDTAKRTLLKIIQNKSNSDVRRCYAIIMLTDLVNGARISESVEAVNKFYNSGERRVEVKVRKKHRRKDKSIPETLKTPTMRYVHIIKEIGSEERKLLSLAITDNVEKFTKKITSYASQYMPFNTHALRHCYVTEMTKQGHSAQVIAGILKCSVNNIVTYTDEEISDNAALKMLER